MAAYTSPDLTKVGQTTLDTTNGPGVVDISRDGWVLLSGRADGPQATRAAVWNPATGTMAATAGPIWAWAISANNQVLRRIDQTGAATPSACIDLVPAGPALPVDPTGVCAPEVTQFRYGRVSPDGRWITLTGPTTDGRNLTTVLIAAADVRAGRWRPRTLDAPTGAAVFWDTATTFILFDTVRQRCDTTGHCAPSTTRAARVSDPGDGRSRRGCVLSAEPDLLGGDRMQAPGR